MTERACERQRERDSEKVCICIRMLVCWCVGTEQGGSEGHHQIQNSEDLVNCIIPEVKWTYDIHWLLQVCNLLSCSRAHLLRLGACQCYVQGTLPPPPPLTEFCGGFMVEFDDDLFGDVCSPVPCCWAPCTPLPAPRPPRRRRR